MPASTNCAIPPTTAYRTNQASPERAGALPLPPAATAPSTIADQLRHVRWLAGGTGSGKSTIAAALARRFDLDIYSGDRAEHDWLTRCSPQRHPHLAALGHHRPGGNWRNRSPEQAFSAMAGRYGETMNFLIEDLSARPSDRIVLVDYFGVLPRDLAPLLSRPAQAAFLVPTPDFRRSALSRRYADPDRAHANWGGLDLAEVLETRLARDALWDAEVTEQADALGLPLLTIDGNRPPEALVDDFTERFELAVAGARSKDGQCLGVAGASKTEGAQVVGYTCLPTHPDQYWDIAYEGSIGGYAQYTVEDLNSQLVLGVAGGSMANGAPVVQWVYNALNQLWLEGSN